MRLPPRRKMRTDSLELHAEQFHLNIKHLRSLDLLDVIPECLQEHCHMSRRTLMSPQECKITWCSPHQLKMKPNSPALFPEPFGIPHHTQQVA